MTLWGRYPGSQNPTSTTTQRLRNTQIEHYKAKDILRAATLPLLSVDNPHVAADLTKVQKIRALSPVLLVRGDLRTGVPLHIADGYHRVCASYHLDENTDIPAGSSTIPHVTPRDGT